MGGGVCALHVALELDAGEALQEVDVEPGAAELAVCDGPQARGELAADGGGDMCVFDGAKVGVVSASGGEDGGRAEERADVVGAVDAWRERHGGR